MIRSSVRRFLIDESGPTATEYAVLLAVILGVLISAIQLIGDPTFSLFRGSAAQLPQN